MFGLVVRFNLKGGSGPDFDKLTDETVPRSARLSLERSSTLATRSRTILTLASSTSCTGTARPSTLTSSSHTSAGFSPSASNTWQLRRVSSSCVCGRVQASPPTPASRAEQWPRRHLTRRPSGS